MEDDQHDQVRWIDTSTMICDPLTKMGNSEFPKRLVSCMTTGWLDLEPTLQSEMKKMSQQSRRLKKAMEPSVPHDVNES